MFRAIFLPLMLLCAVPAAAEAPHKAKGKPALTARKEPDKKARAKPAKLAAKPKPAPAPVAAAPAPETPPDKGSVTGFPLPRFAALRSDDVNFRAGPGTRYPIDWIYNRRDLPVKIEREFDVWRLVRDADGVKGWVHTATLTGRRTMVVLAPERTLRESARDDAPALAVLKPGVVGRIRACDTTDWCQVQVGDYRGYLRRDAFFGTLDHETVGS